MASFTIKEYLKDRDAAYPKDFAPYKDNANKTVEILNKFLKNYTGKLIISSGFRPATINGGTKGAAVKSNHITCLACDFQDMGEFPIMKYVLDNLELAKQLGIYFEDFRSTASWVHMQIIPPASGKRIYKPSSADWIAPKKWNGEYSSEFDGK